MSKYQDELTLAIYIVRKASKITEWFKSHKFQSYKKKDESPVTLADFASQIFILSQLKEKYNEDQIFAEEESSLFSKDIGVLLKKCFIEINFKLNEEFTSLLNYRGSQSNRQWIVDPIDGTKGYLRGLSYAVGIGLMENSEPKICAIGVPNYKNEELAIFIAEQGKGAQASYGDNEFIPIHVSHENNLSSSIMCQSLHHNKQWINKFAEMIEARKIISMDGMGKFCMVADGSADLYIREMNPDYSFSWDYMPGDLLVREAGGTITDLNNVNLTFLGNKCKWTAPGMIASNGILHDDIISNTKKLI
jgi:3'-phosphoadenosine 5'-phosphosulfate (PAPS) 3'-phosphatase